MLGPAGDLGPLVHVRRIPARGARTGSLARPLPPAVAERLGVAALWTHQAAGHRPGPRGPVGRGGAPAPRPASRSATRSPIAEAAAAPVRRGTSLLVFPTKALAHDQLRALAGLEFPGVVAGAYDGDTGTEERAWIRRHATVRAHQPRDAPQRDPSPPRPVGEVPQPAALRRGRRAAHVPGHLRQPRRPPAAAAAAAGQPLRRRPHVRVLLGHHRPARAAGVGVVRLGRRGRWSTTARPGASGWWRCGTRRRSTTATGRRASSNGETAGLRGRAGALRPEDHRVLPQPPVHRGGGGRRPPPVAVPLPPPGQALPGRLPGGGASRDRGRAVRRPPRRRGGHERARAGHRRRRARRRGAERLPRHDRLVLAAGRAGRAVGRASAAVLVAGSDQLDQWLATHPEELVLRGRPSRSW